MAGRLGMLIRAPSLSTYGADKFIYPFRDLIGLIEACDLALLDSLPFVGRKASSFTDCKSYV